MYPNLRKPRICVPRDFIDPMEHLYFSQMFTILLPILLRTLSTLVGEVLTNKQCTNTLPFLRKGNRGDLCSGNPPWIEKCCFYLKDVIIICHLSLRGFRYYK